MTDKKQVDDNHLVKAASICEATRKCCLYASCLGTFVHLSGSNWVLDHCGCKNTGII